VVGVGVSALAVRRRNLSGSPQVDGALLPSACPRGARPLRWRGPRRARKLSGLSSGPYP